MRYFLICLATILGISPAAHGEDPRPPLLPQPYVAPKVSLFQLTEFPEAQYTGLTKLKVQRYNAGLRALLSAKTLQENGKLYISELATVGEQFVTWTLDLYDDPAIRLEILKKRVEFRRFLRWQVKYGGVGPASNYQINLMEAGYLDAQVKLLQAQQQRRTGAK